MINYKRMAGKRVLVTGAGTGIGRGVALEYGMEGAAVALHYSQSSEGAQSAVEEIRGFGGKAEMFQADLSQNEEIRKLADQAVKFLGGIDVLVNNAGITMNLPFEKVAPEQFDQLYSVNIRAMFFVTQALLPIMEKQGNGIVLNLSSTHAFAGQTEHSVYAGTKGAIVAYTRALSLELIQKGIRLNAIAPGWTRTENQELAFGPDFDWGEAERSLPAGFIATPADIGRLAIFLSSDESRFIIGQTIIVDGGQSALMAVSGDFRKPRDQYHFGIRYVPNYKR
jgi:NAD(P)-dependent dehydrogenase (short-subunit alcohol dehydrogenase family)